MMTKTQAILRARSAVGHHTEYRLGCGTMNPSTPQPADGLGRCDCSAFLCWVFCLSKRQMDAFHVGLNGGWLNTDAIVTDADDVRGFFTRLNRATPGCAAVFPHGTGGHTWGHCALVTEIDSGGRPSLVIHCSSGNWAHTGDAIAETNASVFLANPGTVYVWLDGMPK